MSQSDHIKQLLINCFTVFGLSHRFIKNWWKTGKRKFCDNSEKKMKTEMFFSFLFVFKEKENFFRLLSRSMKVVATFLTVFLFSKTFTFLLFLFIFYLMGCITRKLAVRKLLPKHFEIIFFSIFLLCTFWLPLLLLFP